MKFLRYFLPILILSIAGYFTWHLMKSRPEPHRYRPDTSAPEVQVTELQPQDYQIILHSQGIVEARTQSALIPEVRGRIIEISPNFRTGGFFEAGETLVQIDASDYHTALVTAEATVAQMELRYAEEKARSERAELDWKRLGNEVAPTDLVLRRPQLRQAEANLASAKARLEAARLNLQRTRIVAPYAGRILKKNVDVGQYVSPGNQLATLYAIDYAEVRLPLSEAQLGFIDLPENYRGSGELANFSKPVNLHVEAGETETVWTGELVRAEGAFDLRSRQLYVVAQVADPYGHSEEGRPTLKVGSFVSAEIPGTFLHNVYVIPRRLFRESQYLIIVNKRDRIERRQVQPLWTDEENIIVRENISPGERLCLTPIKYASTGMRVKIPDPDEALADHDIANLETLDRVLAAIPKSAKIPLALSTEITALETERDPRRARILVNELRRWAMQKDLGLPQELFNIDRKEGKKKQAKPVAAQS
ncbi:efflux RND transporter periplasmic adaptor subunit [Pelagicoccus mobilis]|uniref:Efflux RND transporter periplasmic adaptor subunit n=1 Tax=Pelagicoccus mobilis TaxID=415221 RepID=A0A934S2Y8_9BACT|nr:efflux RND transporter periplasmic adaptor subunit [Pelagicoccus mobilis]MBK1879691.1 efflux RND transporter periplasmic adaptor subunit [Pelagicoccus mobilis]